MKPKIAVEKIPGILGDRRTAHAVHCRLQPREVYSSDRGKARRQSLNRSPQFIELDHIFLGQEDNSGAAPQLLRDKSVAFENLDCFANRALCDTEFLRPFPLDDSHTWSQCAFHNL